MAQKMTKNRTKLRTQLGERCTALSCVSCHHVLFERKHWSPDFKGTNSFMLKIPQNSGNGRLGCAL